MNIAIATIIASIITAAGGIIAYNWSLFSGPPNSCVAYTSEDYEDYVPCPPRSEVFVEWCSGDCNDDDARVRICCQW